MSMINQLRAHLTEARRARDAAKASLLSTLLAEIEAVGKNAGNRESTDDEAVRVVQKFVKNVDETIAALTKAGTSVPAERLAQAQAERQCLCAYLPAMASEVEIRAEVAQLRSQGVSAMGDVMKALKARFGSKLDGKIASRIAGEP